MAPFDIVSAQVKDSKELSKSLPIEVVEDKKKALLGQKLKKTSMCTFFQMLGKCKFGSECDFAHTEDELQQGPNLRKTRLCQGFKNGHCQNKDCKFAHGLEELRPTGFSFKTALCIWHAKGKCSNGQLCRFAHGTEDLRLPGDAPPGGGGEEPPPKPKPASRIRLRSTAAAFTPFTPAVQNPMKVHTLEMTSPATPVSSPGTPLRTPAVFRTVDDNKALAQSLASISGQLQQLEKRIETIAAAGAWSESHGSEAADSTSAGDGSGSSDDGAEDPPARIIFHTRGPPGLELYKA